ncbi:MAG TPA: nuclear transport factor 2 family protein [Woeseiaceae bacterium]|nr:nuclear transport factor 2 family protein [Woeseiaceae bacterium]
MIKKLPAPVARWFACWNTGPIDDLPITDDFRHTSPFGTIESRARYLEIVNRNRDQFLGNRLAVLRQIVDGNDVCVQFRQTRDDDPDFEMTVREWYVLDGDRIREIESFYNIGDAVIQG